MAKEHHRGEEVFMGEDAHKLGHEVPVTSSAPLSLKGDLIPFFNRLSPCLRKSVFPNTSAIKLVSLLDNRQLTEAD